MSPNDFTYVENSPTSMRIDHNASTYFFGINLRIDRGTISPLGFSCAFAPSETILVQQIQSVSWNSVFKAFKDWVNYVKRETTQPDLWEALAQSHLPITLPEDNSPFTGAERQAIEERLGQIRDYAYRALPSLVEQPEWGQRLEAKIDYLIESSERMGRKDWHNIFVGIIVSFIFTSTMDGNAARDFLEFAWQAIFQIMPSLPN